MFDRSLIFFYGLILCFGIYNFIKIKRDNKRYSIMAYLLSLLASMVFASFIYDFGTGPWCVSAFVLSYFLNFFVIIIFMVSTYFLRKKRFNNSVKMVKNKGAGYLESLCSNEPDDRWHSLHWHVAYSPQQNTLEIAADIYHSEFKLNKKFFSRTLTGRTLKFIPESLTSSFTLEQTVICPLKQFMQHSEEARELVISYAEAIKNDLPEPWVLHKQES
ncbi:MULTISPECIES: hypothetical protein [unclassified Serratia (in: enterobacteria)]|uniref:hypothetical protein n=1 Tax=unclassified Serratia (in: enterobacteria) TaxID=2647522 RepID=UPI0004680F25|nr:MULTISPECIES: hypothetical protein [unclassified Serratia (in: enterobacteria)]